MAARVLRELCRGRGRTVAVPRVAGLARLTALPGLAQATDLAFRSVPAARFGRAFAERHVADPSRDGDATGTTSGERA